VTHTLSGYSRTWKDWNDADYYVDCLYWVYDYDFGGYCYLVQTQFNYAHVKADLYSPTGFYQTVPETDFEDAVAAYSLSISNQSGVWTAEGRHYALAYVYQQYCPYSMCTDPIWIGTWEFSVGSNTQATQSVISLTISRYSTTSLSEGEVDLSILPSSNELLLTNDGGGDVSCSIAFHRYGSINVLSDGDGIIDDSSELATVMGVPGRIEVVNEIKWCNGPPAPGNTITGCASGAGMVLRRWTSEGIIWAHEYGHNQSLSHNANSGFVMYGTLQPGNRRVTQFECDAMRNPLN
jgi:hypothetical protein